MERSQCLAHNARYWSFTGSPKLCDSDKGVFGVYWVSFVHK
jgi:hypothetical protein